MYTYNDFQKIDTTDLEKLSDFVYSAIQRHKSTDLYKNAEIAEEYDKHQNRTINQFQKLLYTVSGKAIPDIWSANYKMASKFFNRFIVQENQYLLGNGISWKNEETAKKLGEDFDIKLQDGGHKALVEGVSFGFFNLDHLEVFSVREFVPLYDEENGALSAGIRFWQVDDNKPLRATVYEMDGYTDLIWKNDDEGGKNKSIGSGKESKAEILNEKRAYILKLRTSEIDGTVIYDGENYPTFPIVPLWGNPHHQSELIGLQEQIDCYDLIKSGFANTVDDASIIYWTIQNADGMDDVDLAKFVERLKTVHAANVDEGQIASNSLDVPYASREALLERLRADLYDDAMALDIKNIVSGGNTATQIRAAYEPLNNKTDQYEYCVVKFIQGILAVAGIEDEPTFTRSKIINMQEEIQVILSAAQYLDSEYVTRKILSLLGDADQADEVLKRMEADELERQQLMDNYYRKEEEAGFTDSGSDVNGGER